MKFIRFFLLLILLFPVNSYAIKTIKYDKWFKQYSEMYQPLKDWRLLKSQGIAESNLDPLAVSYVGASGLMQFMPKTWKDTEHLLKIKGSPFSPELNILFSAYYMYKQEKFWSAPRPTADRTSLALASYNAGAGNLLKAQRLCSNNNLYKDIIICLEDVTGRYSKETIDYVQRIWTFYIKSIYGF